MWERNQTSKSDQNVKALEKIEDPFQIKIEGYHNMYQIINLLNKDDNYKTLGKSVVLIMWLKFCMFG